jgi:hypothetical protein
LTLNYILHNHLNWEHSCFSKNSDPIPHLLQTHDVVICKAGGAILHEVLAAKIPAVIDYVVPGQEEGNAELLLRHDCALRSHTPQETGDCVRRLLENWLTVKSGVLAGEPIPQGVDRIAREGPVALLARERRSDAARGQTQQLDVRITDLSLSESGPRRIVAAVRLRYSDRRLDANGKVVDTTAPMELRNGYVLGRDGDSWRLAATQSLN